MIKTVQKPTEGRLLQFRCPDCGRLLFKYRVGSTQVFYAVEPIMVVRVEGSKIMEVHCTKCKSRLVVTSRGLTRNTNHGTSAQAGPVKQYEVPVKTALNMGR
jgi:DNA-directed RNA polymerase subunit RPC12/RpoP